LYRWFLEHQQLLPRVDHRDDPLNVQWQPATYRRLHWMLKNPAYAGAYVMGRSAAVVERTDGGELVRRRRPVPPEQWEVVGPAPEREPVSAGKRGPGGGCRTMGAENGPARRGFV
jgi:hypothetical protein